MHGPGAWTPFTAAHRGGRGSPLVLLHGFLESWRSWELVLPALERRHDVLAVTLAGHAGGPPLRAGAADADALADGVERAMDEAGFETAHLAGNSLGGWIALALAARGRARSVTAFAPAGGWAQGDDSWRELLAFQRELQRESRAAAPHAAALVATPEGRRRVTRDVVERYEHIPPDLLAHRIEAAAGCTAADAMIETGLRTGWELDAARITAPVRVVWGTADRAPALAVRRCPLSHRVAAPRRLGRARRRRARPAARRAARGGGVGSGGRGRSALAGPLRDRAPAPGRGSAAGRVRAERELLASSLPGRSATPQTLTGG